MLLQTIILLGFIHLCTSQSIGDRINQFSPQWNCNVDSFEYTRSDQNDCDKAIDSNDNTFWHSNYTPSDAPLPHRITIDMGKIYNLRSMTVLPRQDGNSNGNIGNWRISLSADRSGVDRYLNGTWEDDSSRKTVDFKTATPARYVRLDALSEAGGRGTWTSIAQIDIYEDNGSDTPNEPSQSNSSASRKKNKSSGNGYGYGNSTSSEQTARVAVVDGQTVKLGPKPTGRKNGGGYRNSTMTMGMNSSMTATATASSSTITETGTSGQTTSTAGSGEGVGGGAPAGSSDATAGKVPGVGVAMVGLAVAMVMGSMAFQV
ncbi:MAG: hypothetical protein Q9226_000744 [Calogaya cf. arnoldii]